MPGTTHLQALAMPWLLLMHFVHVRTNRHRKEAKRLAKETPPTGSQVTASEAKTKYAAQIAHIQAATGVTGT